MIKRYDQYGRLSNSGRYDQSGKLLQKDNPIKQIKRIVHNYNQKRMIIPTDPIEIKKRANQIRQEINEQKIRRLELADLNKDIELIKFHARLKGKLKPDESSYEDQREKQDTKEFLDEQD